VIVGIAGAFFKKRRKVRQVTESWFAAGIRDEVSGIQGDPRLWSAGSCTKSKREKNK
jgi:hypothetical protein